MNKGNMFDEQQAMQMALDISGNHVTCSRTVCSTCMERPCLVTM